TRMSSARATCPCSSSQSAYTRRGPSSSGWSRIARRNGSASAISPSCRGFRRPAKSGGAARAGATLYTDRGIGGARPTADPRPAAAMRRQDRTDARLPDVVGGSPAMRKVYQLPRLAAPTAANVLLVGETGTGKEVIARAIHRLSKRADGPYIRV